MAETTVPILAISSPRLAVPPSRGPLVDVIEVAPGNFWAFDAQQFLSIAVGSKLTDIFCSFAAHVTAWLQFEWPLSQIPRSEWPARFDLLLSFRRRTLRATGPCPTLPQPSRLLQALPGLFRPDWVSRLTTSLAARPCLGGQSSPPQSDWRPYARASPASRSQCAKWMREQRCQSTVLV